METNPVREMFSDDFENFLNEETMQKPGSTTKDF